MTDDRHLSRWPLEREGKLIWLTDRRGRRLSYHRTTSGALRRRRELIEDEELWK